MRCILPNGASYTKEQVEAVEHFIKVVKEAWNKIKEVIQNFVNWLDGLKKDNGHLLQLPTPKMHYRAPNIKPLTSQVMNNKPRFAPIRNNC